MLEPATHSWTQTEAAHLLNRAGFGGSPAEIAAFHRLGRTAAIEALLTKDEDLSAFPFPEWTEQAAALAELKQYQQARKEFRQASRTMTPEEAAVKRREMQQAESRLDRQRMMEAREWWVRRMLASKVPLREKMTLFWHDHFSTSAQKVREPVFLMWQNETFRRHAFGSFRELTQAMLYDPAMVLYLDVQSSKKGKPNENFPREVMELFTLGEGHYSEKDIREAARAMTGYELIRAEGKVFHNRRQWDDGVKTCFGQTGNFDGEQVINLIFQQPQPAKFMAKKIWEFFVAEDPATATIDELAKNFRTADYRIEVLLREIFNSKEFYAPSVIRNQIKCPVQYTVSLMKQLEIAEAPKAFSLVAQQQLGQTLFAPPNVAGWDWGKAWINTNSLLTRYNLAGYLTKGSADAEKNIDRERGQAMMQKMLSGKWEGPDYEKIAPRPTRENPAALVDGLIARFFQGPVPEKARLDFINYAQDKKGLIFTNKEVAELCLLILSTPYYQLN